MKVNAKYRLMLHMRSGHIAQLPICENFNIEWDRAKSRITKISVSDCVEPRVGERVAILEAIDPHDVEFVNVEEVPA